MISSDRGAGPTDFRRDNWDSRTASGPNQGIRGDAMNSLPVERVLNIYVAIADRVEPKDARARLSEHLMKMYIDGERDEHRLTVHGLSYLQQLDRERDSMMA